jgi:hypothetical protein
MSVVLPCLFEFKFGRILGEATGRNRRSRN